MKTRTFGRFNLLMAIAICGVAMMALPQKAHALFGMQCPFEKNELLSGALCTVGAQTGKKIVVVNSKGMIVASSMCGKSGMQCDKAKSAQCDKMKSAQCDKMKSAQCDKAKAAKKCGKVDCPELNQTLADGKTRTVTKKCGNKSITATVTALRNAKNQIIGAVITAGK